MISKLRELPADAIKHLTLQLLTPAVLNPLAVIQSIEKPSSSTEFIIRADHGETPPPNRITQQYPETFLCFAADEKTIQVKVACINFHYALVEK